MASIEVREATRNTCEVYQSRAAESDPSTIDEATRSIGTIVATEAMVRMRSYADGDYDEILRMDGAELPDQLILLDSHPHLDPDHRFCSEDVRGATRELKIDGDKLRGRNCFDDDEDSERLWNKVRKGFIRDNSVGYVVLERAILQPGSRSLVMGREHQAGDSVPLHVATKWRPLENSVTPIGKDGSAKMRGLTPPNQEDDMAGEADETKTPKPKDVKATESGRATTPNEAGTVTTGTTETRHDTRDPIDLQAERARWLKEEAERKTEIRALAEGLHDRALVDRAIDEGWSPARAAKEFLVSLRSTATPPAHGNPPADHSRGPENLWNPNNGGTRGPGIHTAPEITPGMIHDGMMLRYGFARFKESEGQRAENAERYSRWGSEDYLRELLRLAQKPIHRGDRTQMLAELNRLSAREGAQIVSGRTAGQVSTISVPNVLSNLVNKALMVGFQEAKDTTFWVKVRPVSDFKLNNRMRLGAFPTPPAVPEGATVEHTTFDEEYESFVTVRYGHKLVLDEITVFNDDLDAFFDRAMKLGDALRRLRPDKVYDVLLNNAALSDSITLAHATSHGGNLLSGAGSACGPAGISAAKRIMRGQTGQQGEQLNIDPAYIIGSEYQEDDILSVLGSSELRSDASKYGIKNPNFGLAQPVIEPRIANTSFNSNASSTLWFMLADSRQTPTIEVGPLRDWPEPVVMEMVMTEITQREWQAKWAIAAKALDYRGVVRCEGV